MTDSNTMSSTIYIRVPPVLKRDIERAAAQANQSVNTWIQRRLEEATLRKPVRGA